MTRLSSVGSAQSQYMTFGPPYLIPSIDFCTPQNSQFFQNISVWSAAKKYDFLKYVAKNFLQLKLAVQEDCDGLLEPSSSKFPIWQNYFGDMADYLWKTLATVLFTLQKLWDGDGCWSLISYSQIQGLLTSGKQKAR